MDADNTIRSLREALAVSPDNTALRQLLGETLLAHGHHEDAETEFKAGLKIDGRNQAMMLLLAKSYRTQGKFSAAVIVLEQLVARGNDRARIDLARVLLSEGDVENAVRQYKKALEADETLHDDELSERLGVDNDEPDEDAEIVDGRLRSYDDESNEDCSLIPIRSDIKFLNVGGLTDLKKEIAKKIVLPMQQPELYKAYGKKAGGGILMYGPPGCGKTFLAKATAGEVDAKFLCIGIHDVLDMWVGKSERNLHGIFETARKHRPCVLF
ncbi:MAG: transitional endoplasmic reticulum ATPase, partial [Planctomycetota bacterium]